MTDSFVDVNNKYLKQITEKLIGVPDFDPLLRRVKGKIDDTSSSVESITDKIELRKQLIQEKKITIKKYRRQHEEFEHRQKKRQKNLNVEIARYEGGLKKAKRLKKKFSRLYGERQREAMVLGARLKVLERAKSAISENGTKFKWEVADKKARRDILNEIAAKYRKVRDSKKICPECGQKVSIEHIKAKMNEHAEEYSDIVMWLAQSKVTESRNEKAEVKVKRHYDQVHKLFDRCKERGLTGTAFLQ
jgi:chromosome segregation ATPase